MKSTTKTRTKNLGRVGWDGQAFAVPEDLLADWRLAFPAVDVAAAILRAAAWLRANGPNAKRHHERYVVNWLLRDQERAPMRRRPATGRDGMTYDERVAEYGRRLDEARRGRGSA